MEEGYRGANNLKNPKKPGKRVLGCFYCTDPKQEFEKRKNGVTIPLRRGRDNVPRHQVRKTSTIIEIPVHGPKVPNVGTPRFICAKHAKGENSSVMFGRDDHNERLRRKTRFQILKSYLWAQTFHRSLEAIEAIY